MIVVFLNSRVKKAEKCQIYQEIRGYNKGVSVLSTVVSVGVFKFNAVLHVLI